MGTGELDIKVFGDVYRPREDSYLLADTTAKFAFGETLDMGTGTGIQGIVAAKNGCTVTFCDINPNSIECAKANAKSNGVSGNFVVSDLFDNINGKFDTIIFNPPYLIGNRNDVALDGGENGRYAIDRFLESYKKHVKENHIVLLVESSFNGYEKDLQKLRAKIVSKGHYFFEDIVVLRF